MTAKELIEKLQSTVTDLNAPISVTVDYKDYTGVARVTDVVDMKIAVWLSVERQPVEEFIDVMKTV